MEGFEWKGDRVYTNINPRIYSRAVEFYKIAINNYEVMHEPIIVNLAFSIELFLKSLNSKVIISLENDFDSIIPILKSRTQCDKGHTLFKLFKNIDSKYKIEIIRKYNSKFENDFEDDLTQISNAFIDYRYTYEKDFISINLLALQNISLFLKEYIYEKMNM